MMPESVCFDEFFIIKKSGTKVPLLYIKLKLVGEANAPSPVFYFSDYTTQAIERSSMRIQTGKAAG